MNRRRLFKLAAGGMAAATIGVIPMVDEIVQTLNPETLSPSLTAIRDLLLPALYQGKGKLPLADIVIDYTNDVLLVIKRGIDKGGTPIELGFAITRARIIDGTYKGAFKPSLDMLCRLVDNEEHREKFT